MLDFQFSEIKTHYYYFFFQAEDGIRDVERSRGLGDVYKRQDSVGLQQHSTQGVSSAASDVYKRQGFICFSGHSLDHLFDFSF